MRIGLIVGNRRMRDPNDPHGAVREGLRRLGHQVEVVCPGDWPVFCTLPDVAFLWNAVHGRRGVLAAELRRRRIPVLVMEHGFFDRRTYTQIDPLGFNHTASWTGVLQSSAPPDGARRFREAWGKRVRPMRARDGYVLIVLQVPKDAQLRDSEIRHPGPFVGAVEDALPRSVDIRVRPHPRSDWLPGATNRSVPVESGLEDAVRGAAFVVTINSNTGNEALAWGCPVLCLGPALYADAGVARPTGLAGLAEALAAVLAGWRPGSTDVRNYLHHLACRQWSLDELADGYVLAKLLDDVARTGTA